MKNTFKISALVIASFAVSSLSAQALKGNDKLPSNANRANDGNRVNQTVNTKKTQTINAGQNSNVNVAQPNKNASSISDPGSVSPTNQAKVAPSSRQNTIDASKQDKSNLNSQATQKVQRSKAFKQKSAGKSQKSGSNNSGL